MVGRCDNDIGIWIEFLCDRKPKLYMEQCFCEWVPIKFVICPILGVVLGPFFIYTLVVKDVFYRDYFFITIKRLLY